VARPKKASRSVRKREGLELLRSVFDDSTVHPGHPEFKADRFEKVWEAAQEITEFAYRHLHHYMVDEQTGKEIPPAEFHKEIYELLLTVKLGAVAAPRAHAKSTVVSLIFVLYCICRKLRRFILLVSDTEPQAILFLAAIKEELESNESIREDYGDLIGEKKWAEKDIITSTGIRVSSRGAGSSLRGLRQRQYRPDLIICDDIENDESVGSDEQREKLKEWFFSALMNLGGPYFQIFVIGTILHDDSLLSELLDENQHKRWAKRFYEACDENFENVLWPERWTKALLEEKCQDIGSIIFDKEFRNQPINKATQIFKEEWIRYYEESDLDRAKLSSMVSFMAVDPAISEKTSADYFAIVTISRDSAGFLYVRRAFQDRMDVPSQRDKIFEFNSEDRPMMIGIETVAYQKALKQIIDEKGRIDGIYPPVFELPHTTDKILRISSTSPLVENGTVKFRKDQKPLIKQLLRIQKTKHDDLADAFEGAISLCRQLGEAGKAEYSPIGKRRMASIRGTY